VYLVKFVKIKCWRKTQNTTKYHFHKTVLLSASGVVRHTLLYSQPVIIQNVSLPTACKDLVANHSSVNIDALAVDPLNVILNYSFLISCVLP
jgi:hypothetical protein